MSAGRSKLAAAVLAAAAAAAAAAAPPEDAGRSIYLRGVLPSGAPLEGARDDGTIASGADAACVNCHQRSGLGSVEGTVSIPPITGEYLFHPRATEARQPGLPYVETLHGNRDPYTDATLAKAIREGVDSQGRPLSYLMPRFALGDEDMAALIEYLKQLGLQKVSGVSDSVLHFATVVTPDADPVKRHAMLDVLEQFFAQKNQVPLKPSPRMLTSSRTQFSKSMYMANRHWQLHVWELTGAAAGWRAQLDRQLASQPVYAVLSGAAGAEWKPVHDFCEEHAIPCLFPNVEVPVVSEHDFYPLYFSKGVLLEAQLIANAIAGRADGASVEQVYRAGDSGERAANALAALLEERGISVRKTIVKRGAPAGAVKAALRRHARGDTLVLWLRPGDLAALGDPPSTIHGVYVSGLLGGLERSPLPASWRARAVMTYPFDLPAKRGVRLDYPLGWFSVRHIPVVAEQVQTDTYLACSLLADVLNRMADNFAQPFLIEQLQGLLEHRIITGYYPRLTLASNQRFASKGGYLVHFRDPVGTAVVPESDWIVP